MTAALLVGAGIGLAVMVLVSALAPARPPLPVALARLRPPLRPPATVDSPAAALLTRAARSVARTLGLPGLVESPTALDRRIVGRSLDDHVVTCVAAALVGAALPPATTAVMAAGGVAVPLAVPAMFSAALAVAGFVMPSLTLRSEATDRRRSFRHALSSFLDLVAVTLAGGAGVETALHRSADTGRGWAFEEIRQALLASRLLGETPWAGLDRLGVELGVVELRELAASIALAGEDGAKVRASIAAKARALRTRGVTDSEAAAQAATERMSLPIVLLMLGFMVFVTYPAIARILTGV
jgi:hypothetical protein